MSIAILVAIGIPIALIIFGFRVLAEYERGVVFRFGRYIGVKTAGLRWIIPAMSDDAITRLNAALEGRYSIERELGEDRSPKDSQDWRDRC